MPKRKLRYAAIRVSRKSQIKEVALDLWAKHGYSNVSIQQIAQAAKISKGLIYNYFESKEALLKDILHQTMDQMMLNFDLNQDGILQQNELEHYIHFVFDSVKKNRDFYKLYYELLAQPSVIKLLEEKMNEVQVPMTEMMIKYFENKGCKDPITETALLTGIMTGVTQKHVQAPEYYPLDKIEKRIIEMFK